MAVILSELAELIHGELIGDGNQVIKGAQPLFAARAGDITFVEDAKHAPAFHLSTATAAIVDPSFPVNGKAVLRVDDPRAAFCTVHGMLYPGSTGGLTGIHPSAVVHPSAKLGLEISIGAGAVIAAGVVIGARTELRAGAVVGQNCRIGDDVVLHPHVVLYDGCVLGNRVIIHANSVIGADGFGYKFSQGRHVKVPQIGRVEIDDDVEIGACSTIDRATFGATRIGAGTKIDNLVMIAHNCQIGRHNIMCSQVGVAGSVTTGDYVVMAGQVGVSDHIEIGEGAQLGAQAGVIKNVPPRVNLWGTPAVPHRDRLRSLAHIEKLPEIRKSIKMLMEYLQLEVAADEARSESRRAA